MVQTTLEVFYFGTMADLDPYEGNFSSEYAGDLVGLTFGDPSAPLYDEISLLTMDDANNDGGITENDFGAAAEDLIFDGTASALDATLTYNVTITYQNGSTATTQMVVLQDESGRVFLAPQQTGSSYNDPLDDYVITSITLDSLAGDGYSGVVTGLEQDAFIVCFAGGTLIDTDQGQVDVAHLSVGDRVRTMDHGFQEIRWIGGRRVCAVGNVAPIRIGAGALGQGMPARDLLVSPQHRILVRSKISMRMFGISEVLIAAKKLVGLPGVKVDNTLPFVTYWHFLFNRHEIVFSEGAATESLFTGPEALKALCPDARREILSFFPQLETTNVAPDAARQIIHGHAQNRMVVRHKKNAQPIYQA